MFCPQCGQEQASAELRFCSRCGFQLGGVIGLLASGGNAPALSTQNGDSPRRKGLKQGLFIFLLSFLVVPIISIITIWLRAEPFLVSLAAVVLLVGGFLRMAYAMMFEPKDATSVAFQPPAAQFGIHQTNAGQLPPSQSIPADAFVPPRAASWRDTNNLEPASVVDNTTKLLQQEEEPQ